MKNGKHNFGISVSVDTDTGAPIAVYLQFRKGKSVETREFCEGSALADYSKDGQLLGGRITSDPAS